MLATFTFVHGCNKGLIAQKNELTMQLRKFELRAEVERQREKYVLIFDLFYFFACLCICNLSDRSVYLLYSFILLDCIVVC